MYSIGELARETGVKVPTIRYYEQMGLIDALVRTGGNQRRYSKEGQNARVLLVVDQFEESLGRTKKNTREPEKNLSVAKNCLAE